MMMKKFYFMLEFDTKKFLTKKWVSWEVLFKGLGVQKEP